MATNAHLPIQSPNAEVVAVSSTLRTKLQVSSLSLVSVLVLCLGANADVLRVSPSQPKGQTQKVRAAQEKKADALLDLARSELDRNHPHQSQLALSGFGALSSATAIQYLRAAELYSAAGQNQKALAALEKARAKDKQLDRLDYVHAVILDRSDRSQEALTILKKLASTQADGNVLNLLAHTAEKNGDLTLALQSLRQAATLNPDVEDNYLDFSTICEDHQSHPLALEAVNIGLEHIPNSYRLLVQRGVVLESLGRIDEAEASLLQASQLRKDNSVALLSLAIVQTHAGQLEEARATLTRALQDFPDNFYMHYHMGKLLVQMQETSPSDLSLQEKAARSFEQAIQLEPTYADSYYQLGKLLRQKSPRVAEQNLLACLRIDPNHASAEYTLARLYLSSGRQAAGQRLIDRFEAQQQAEKAKAPHEISIQPKTE